MRLKYMFTVLSIGLFLAGCVKERGNNFVNQSSPSSTTVGFPNQTETAALNIQTAPTIYTFYVETNAGDNNSKSAVTVTITKNASIVAAGGYEFQPDSAYQLVNTTATADPSTGLAAFHQHHVQAAAAQIRRQAIGAGNTG